MHPHPAPARLLVVVVLAALAGCGGRQASEPPPSTVPPTSTVRVAPPPSSGDPCTGVCPGEGAICGDRGPDWRCACTEQYDVNCGGAQRALAPPIWAWSCTPSDPGRDRGDGCPYAEPAEGASCSGDRTCRYPDVPCGWNGRDTTCTGGTWHVTSWAMPPPP